MPFLKKYTIVEIRGVTYAGVREAAEALGVCDDTVSRAIRRGTLHRVGLGRPGVEPFPVMIRGRTYPSVKDAARRLRVKEKTIYKAISDGDPDRVGRHSRGNNNARSRPISIGPLRFRSCAEAARSLGFHHEYVSKAIRNDRRGALENIMAAAMVLSARGVAFGGVRSDG